MIARVLATTVNPHLAIAMSSGLFPADARSQSTFVHFLVVEDQNMFRNAIKRELSEQYPGCKFTEARTLAELQGLSHQLHDYHLAVVDLELPDGTALDWISEVSQLPNAPLIIILSSVEAKHEFIVYRAAEAGIPGFVHKNDDTSVLHQAIRIVMSGGMFFSPTVQQMRRHIQGKPDFFNKILTPREQEMLRYIGEGHSNEEIAEKMAIRLASVLEHRKRIMTKLDIHKERELMRYALEKGFSRI